MPTFSSHWSLQPWQQRLIEKPCNKYYLYKADNSQLLAHHDHFCGSLWRLNCIISQGVLLTFSTSWLIGAHSFFFAPGPWILVDAITNLWRALTIKWPTQQPQNPVWQSFQDDIHLLYLRCKALLEFTVKMCTSKTRRAPESWHSRYTCRDECVWMCCRYPGVSEDPSTPEDPQAEGELWPPGSKSHRATGAQW